MPDCPTCTALREALEEALDEWHYSASYKSDMQRAKDGDGKRIAELRALLTATRPHVVRIGTGPTAIERAAELATRPAVDHQYDCGCYWASGNAVACEKHRPKSPAAPQEQHRCAGCGHRWDGPLRGAELCGDCWRKGQAAIHARPEASPAAPSPQEPKS